MRVQLTKRFVATLKPQDRPFERRDAQVRGLLMRVQLNLAAAVEKLSA